MSTPLRNSGETGRIRLIAEVAADGAVNFLGPNREPKAAKV